jgi:hypothetical protein
MGLLTVLKKLRQKEKEMRLLMLYVEPGCLLVVEVSDRMNGVTVAH